MKRETRVKKLKTIEDLANSGQCPCPICSSQDLKVEGDDEFEIVPEED